MGCQCSQPNKDKQVLIEQNKQIVPEEDSNSKSNMNINPQIDNNEKEKEKKEETPQVLSSIPEPPKEEKKEEPTTPKEQENKDPNIEVIKEDSGKLIYSGKLKVALNRGEPLFREVIEILKNTPHLEPLTFNDSIKIECPLVEEEIKDPKVFQNKIIEKKKQVELHAYFKDAIKDPYISTLLMIVDDSGKNAGKKRESLLNPEFKNIAISAIMVHKAFCAYFTFSK